MDGGYTRIAILVVSRSMSVDQYILATPIDILVTKSVAVYENLFSVYLDPRQGRSGFYRTSRSERAARVKNLAGTMRDSA